MTTTQTPTPYDQRALRDVLGQYPTGIVLVTALVDGRRVGFAANSFTSVSLDPPLVSFCAGHSSSTWPELRKAAEFTISILGAEQDELCRLFSRKGADRFTQSEWTAGENGHPVHPQALAYLECQAYQTIAAGDHDLILARVTRFKVNAGEPLLFHRGRISTAVITPVPDVGR